MIVSASKGVHSSFHHVHFRLGYVQDIAALPQHPVVRGHLLRPHSNAGSNIGYVLNSLESILNKLTNEPIEAFHLLEIFSSLAIKWMLKSRRWKTLQRYFLLT